jgi:hypothetical protein
MVRARALVIGFILYIVSESVLLHSNREIFVVTVLSHVIRDLKYLVKVRANLSLSLSQFVGNMNRMQSWRNGTNYYRYCYRLFFVCGICCNSNRSLVVFSITSFRKFASARENAPRKDLPLLSRELELCRSAAGKIFLLISSFSSSTHERRPRRRNDDD